MAAPAAAAQLTGCGQRSWAPDADVLHSNALLAVGSSSEETSRDSPPLRVPLKTIAAAAACSGMKGGDDSSDGAHLIAPLSRAASFDDCALGLAAKQADGEAAATQLHFGSAPASPRIGTATYPSREAGVEALLRRLSQQLRPAPGNPPAGYAELSAESSACSDVHAAATTARQLHITPAHLLAPAPCVAPWDSGSPLPQAPHFGSDGVQGGGSAGSADGLLLQLLPQSQAQQAAPEQQQQHAEEQPQPADPLAQLLALLPEQSSLSSPDSRGYGEVASAAAAATAAVAAQGAEPQQPLARSLAEDFTICVSGSSAQEVQPQPQQQAGQLELGRQADAWPAAAPQLRERSVAGLQALAAAQWRQQGGAGSPTQLRQQGGAGSPPWGSSPRHEQAWSVDARCVELDLDLLEDALPAAPLDLLDDCLPPAAPPPPGAAPDVQAEEAAPAAAPAAAVAAFLAAAAAAEAAVPAAEAPAGLLGSAQAGGHGTNSSLLGGRSSLDGSGGAGEARSPLSLGLSFLPYAPLAAEAQEREQREGQQQLSRQQRRQQAWWQRELGQHPHAVGAVLAGQYDALLHQFEQLDLRRTRRAVKASCSRLQREAAAAAAGPRQRASLLERLLGGCLSGAPSSSIRLGRALERERHQLLCLGRLPYTPDAPLHFELWQAVCLGYTGQCPIECHPSEMGSAPPPWALLGFRAANPAGALAEAGVLPLLMLLMALDRAPLLAECLLAAALGCPLQEEEEGGDEGEGGGGAAAAAELVLPPFSLADLAVQATLWTLRQLGSGGLNGEVRRLGSAVAAAEHYCLGALSFFVRFWEATALAAAAGGGLDDSWLQPPDRLRLAVEVRALEQAADVRGTVLRGQRLAGQRL